MRDRNQPQAHVPPHSDEAEQALLGALLMDNAAWDHVADLVAVEHFYHPDHRAIFTTIGQLITANKPADVVTVFERGGHDIGYLNDLCTGTPSATRIRGYGELVQLRWREREAMRIAASLADDARRTFVDHEALAARLDQAITALMQLTHGGEQREPKPVAELALQFVDHVVAVSEGKEDTIPTGFTDIDRLTANGIRGGELWVLGARPSMGKTALTNAIARNTAKVRGSLFCSQEDSFTALISRNVAALGRVNLADLRNPARAPESMWSGLTDGVGALCELNLWMDDQPALTLADVRRKAQQVMRKTALGVVMVDYLQLMTGPGDNRNLELGRIANGLKAMAKELGVGVILLSQLNRDVDKRLGPPQMSDLRDSGDIEGAADLIGLLHREYKRNPTEANKHHAELHVVKHKNGATGVVDLFFDGAFQRFADWDGPPPQRGSSKTGQAKKGLE